MAKVSPLKTGVIFLYKRDWIVTAPAIPPGGFFLTKKTFNYAYTR